MNTKKHGLVLVIAAFALGTVACAAKTDAKKSGVSRSSSATSPAGAKTEKQKAGGKSSGAASSGENRGAEVDSVTCDAELEDVGFCGDDAHVVVCKGGSWYAVDCGQIESGAFCGEVDGLVDCYAAE